MDVVEQRIARLEQKLEQMGSALERAERESRALRGRSGHTGRGARLAQLAAACGATATIGALTMGTAAAKPGPQSLTVKAPFKVVGNSGQPFMGVDANGLLTIYRNRRPAVVLGPGEDAFGLVQVYSPSGDPVAELSALANGTGQLAVVGDEGQVARLGASPDVINQLTLRFYKGGAVQARVGADKDGGTLHLNAEHGPSVDLGTTQSGQTTLLFMQGNKILGGVGASSTGGLLQLNNATGKKMLLLGENSNSGTVEVYDTAGQTKILLATTPAGRAELNLLYSDGNPAVQLAEVSAGGYFSLTNRSGVARVEAGILPSDQGILRVFGPGGFDYIRGRK